MKLSLLLDGLVKERIFESKINNISYEPKKCGEGDLLFLINNRAINEYIALTPKAVAIVTNITFSHNTEVPIYTAINIREALSTACSRMYCRDLSKIKFIGITGTNGKSTTAIMLEKILCSYGYKVGYIGTGRIRVGDEILSENYYSMTTPPPDILYSSIGKMENMGVEIIVMEVTSHALDQARVSPINFEIGMFTNLSEEHLDYHKTMPEYLKAKKKLLEKSRHIVVNSDDPYGRDILFQYKNADGCGCNFYTTVQVDEIKDMFFSGSEFNYRSDLNNVSIRLRLPGMYNIYNAILAIRAAEILEVPMINIKKSIEKTQKIEGRFDVIDDSVKIIIDYAHTAFAFENLLKNLYSMKNIGQNLCIVFGCGGERDQGKRGRMGGISEKYADTVIVTSDNPRGEDPLMIIKEITTPMKKSPIVIVDRKDAIRYAILSANEGDIIAIVGKGPENYSISKGVYYSFNETEIIRNALEERKKCE